MARDHGTGKRGKQPVLGEGGALGEQIRPCIGNRRNRDRRIGAVDRKVGDRGGHFCLGLPAPPRCCPSHGWRARVGAAQWPASVRAGPRPARAQPRRSSPRPRRGPPAPPGSRRRARRAGRPRRHGRHGRHARCGAFRPRQSRCARAAAPRSCGGRTRALERRARRRRPGRGAGAGAATRCRRRQQRGREPRRRASGTGARTILPAGAARPGLALRQAPARLQRRACGGGAARPRSGVCKTRMPRLRVRDPSAPKMQQASFSSAWKGGHPPS